MESLRRYILNYAGHLKVDPRYGVAVASLGQWLGTKQVGINVVLLPPGTRSSQPHAESLEEEFGYVLYGNPSVWINGETYRLGPGHAVGFPSGTGLCHTILNDGPGPACVLAIGERTKPENQWIAPLNPERRQSAGGTEWWESWPAQKFGPHPGIPGSGLEPMEPEGVPEILFAPGLPGRASFSYSGDTETFTEGVRLNARLKLKAVGINHEILPPGKRTSWPHAESKEEEFCFVLHGHPTIWINGHLLPAKPGDLVFFAPGTNLAHTVLNETSEPVEFLGFGPTSEACPGNRIYYPFHDARNADCRARGDLWEDRPAVTLGPDDGRARKQPRV